MTKMWVIENVSRLEKIAYNASWRNFIFANFAEKSFSSATLHITQYKKAPTFAVSCDLLRQHTYRKGAPL